MKKFIEELENKKYSQYQKLIAKKLNIQEYLSETEKIDKEIEIANKAINWLNKPEKKRTVAKRRFNWLKFSAIALLIFILFSFSVAITTANSFKKQIILEDTIITPSTLQEIQNIENITIPSEEPQWISLGTFVTSGYCNEPYYHTCNDGTADTTATMTIPTAGRTIAVDPRVIPYGSEVMINGHTYIAEDCGSAIKGKRIDILYDNHDIAFAHGMQEVEVFIKINN